MAMLAAQQVREHHKANNLSQYNHHKPSMASLAAGDGLSDWHRHVNRLRHTIGYEKNDDEDLMDKVDAMTANEEVLAHEVAQEVAIENGMLEEHLH